jgi:hypothetical protein
MAVHNPIVRRIEEALEEAARYLYIAEHAADEAAPRWESALATVRQDYRDLARRSIEKPTVTAAAEPFVDAREPVDPIKVECVVTVPLTGPADAAHVLSRVPINADLQYEAGTGIIAGLLGVGAIRATWTEER